MTIMLDSPYEVAGRIAKHARAKRLALNLSQKSLSERSGVSFGVRKSFLIQPMTAFLKQFLSSPFSLVLL